VHTLPLDLITLIIFGEEIAWGGVQLNKFGKA
jgi:hypothetical protein